MQGRRSRDIAIEIRSDHGEPQRFEIDPIGPISGTCAIVLKVAFLTGYLRDPSLPEERIRLVSEFRLPTVIRAVQAIVFPKTESEALIRAWSGRHATTMEEFAVWAHVVGREYAVEGIAPDLIRYRVRDLDGSALYSLEDTGPISPQTSERYNALLDSLFGGLPKMALPHHGGNLSE